MTLAELPTTHVLRNTPLIDIQAHFIYPGEKVKRRVQPTWKIATKSFNDLGPAWTEHADWFALDPSPPIS